MDIKRKIKILFPNIYIWKSTLRNKRYSKMNNDQIKEEISQLYEFHLGRKLDWSNLRRFTEKMQWKKIFYVDPLEKIASDKYAVRDWVSKKIGAEYLIPMLGIWDNFKDIDFEKMPDKFVLKTTHSSANVIIVKDKNKLDKKYSALMFKLWLSMDYAYASFEMNYKDIPRKIIAEEYMQNSNGELPDYKFMCFDGKPYCCWIDKGRFTNHTRDFYDMDWELLPYTEIFPNSGEPNPKPINFDQMVKLVTVLSEGFSHVRVDLYNIDGKIYFGEMTFCESSGFCEFSPDEYDYVLGDMWNLPIE